MRSRPVLAAGLVVAVLMGAGCAPTDDKKAPPTEKKNLEAATPSADRAVKCGKGEKLIKSVRIAGKHVPDQRIPEQTVGGKTIAAQTVEGFDIPARTIPAQCVDVAPAPGGCLGAVTIPSATIPGVKIPGARIPGVHEGGIDVDSVSVDAVSTGPVTVSSVHVPEVCQTKPKKEGEYVEAVYRESVYRESAYREALYRESLYRKTACNDDGDCIKSVTVPGVSVRGVSLPGVSYPGASLKGFTAGRADVYKGDGKIAYNVKADVLFDFGKAEIKPDAVPDLKEIAASIKKEVPDDEPVQVDGHTDAKGGEAANVDLSERRAKAIADWLATDGGIDRSRLHTKGYGETKPVAANTKKDGSDNPDGRAKNRRVVISAHSK